MILCGALHKIITMALRTYAFRSFDVTAVAERSCTFVSKLFKLLLDFIFHSKSPCFGFVFPIGAFLPEAGRPNGRKSAVAEKTVFRPLGHTSDSLRLARSCGGTQ